MWRHTLFFLFLFLFPLTAFSDDFQFTDEDLDLIENDLAIHEAVAKGKHEPFHCKLSRYDITAEDLKKGGIAYEHRDKLKVGDWVSGCKPKPECIEKHGEPIYSLHPVTKKRERFRLKCSICESVALFDCDCK